MSELAYLGGAIAATLSLPLGWIILHPAGWEATRALIEQQPPETPR